jgi:two-component system NarL family response regulator
MRIEMNIRLFLAVEHPLVRRGIAGLCASQQDVHVVGEAADGDSAWRGIQELRPDVIVAHAALPLRSGTALISLVRAELPAVKSIILVPLNDRARMREAMASAADAFLLTTDLPQHVLRTARALRGGERFVCPLLAACSATLLNDAIPAEVRERLDEPQLALFRQIIAQRNGSQIGRALGISSAEAAQRRIDLCEQLHRVSDASQQELRPVDLLSKLPKT